ncbi:MAG: U32 family peptidase [Eggerthellaceae bacterium]|jgi:putative protease
MLFARKSHKEEASIKPEDTGELSLSTTDEISGEKNAVGAEETHVDTEKSIEESHAVDGPAGGQTAEGTVAAASDSCAQDGADNASDTTAQNSAETAVDAGAQDEKNPEDTPDAQDSHDSEHEKPDYLSQLPYPDKDSDKVELLAPAGGRPQLEAAIRFGADAVYLACDKFGMRARADNFRLEEIPDAVRFAHEHGVRVYVTLNVLMNDADLDDLPDYCEALQESGVDAFIIGDLGAFAIAKKYAPRVHLHVSTQASVANAEAARMWYELGARRVVCAREMSLEDIRAMRKKIPEDLELEVFVHGAMCMAVSGRCLLSSVMTGRSANKGACAQSCRWSYALVEEKRPGEFFPIEEDTRGSYIFNAQDMNLIEHLDELKAAGINSFKIEGRNKKSFYVATVVRAYRQVMDGGNLETAKQELETISHRPYGTGFFFGRPDQSPDQDGYIKNYIHVATVFACEPSGKDSYRVVVTCMNRFYDADELELVAPFRETKKVRVEDLMWLPECKDTDGHLTEGGPSPALTHVANRAKNMYVFTTSVAMEKGDYLRKRMEELEENMEPSLSDFAAGDTDNIPIIEVNAPQGHDGLNES